jgi:hypothetical protein
MKDVVTKTAAKGNVRAEAMAEIEKTDSGIMKINFQLQTEISGVSGVADGAATLIFIDGNDKPIMTMTLADSVGANALSGHAQKKTSKDRTILKDVVDQIKSYELSASVDEHN